MKYKRSILIVLLICSMIQISTISVRADLTKEVKPYADSSVDNYFPDINYGSSDFLEIGANLFGYQQETFLKFRIPTVETKITRVYISSYWYSFLCETPLSVSACYVSDSWNEYTINWNNKPSHGTVIDSDLTLADGEYFIIDFSLTDITQGSTLSLCIYENTPFKPNGLQAGSREGGLYTPKLIVEYETPLLLIILPIVIGVAIAGAIGVTIFLIIHKKRQNQLHVKQEKLQTIAPNPYTVSATKFCTDCGSKVDGKFCSSCGKEQP